MSVRLRTVQEGDVDHSQLGSWQLAVGTGWCWGSTGKMSTSACALCSVRCSVPQSATSPIAGLTVCGPRDHVCTGPWFLTTHTHTAPDLFSVTFWTQVRTALVTVALPCTESGDPPRPSKLMQSVLFVTHPETRSGVISSTCCCISPLFTFLVYSFSTIQRTRCTPHQLESAH